MRKQEHVDFLNLHRAGRVTHQPEGGGDTSLTYETLDHVSSPVGVSLMINGGFLCAWWGFSCWIDILLVYIYIYIEVFFFIEFTLVFIPVEGRKEEKTANVTYSCTPTSYLYLCSSL